MVKSIILVLLMLSAAACSNVQQKATDSNKSVKLQRDNFSRFANSSPEKESTEILQTGSLLTRATEFEQAGDYLKSIDYIERSLRIDPENAYLWYRLANAYFKMGNYEQAIQFANRSNRYSMRDKRQQTINSNLIKHARLYISSD